MRRWPFQPLVDELGTRTRNDACERLGISGFTYDNYATHGMTDLVADRRATYAGLHPAQVWGWDWVTAGLTPLDELFLESGWRQAWLWAEETAA